MIAAKTEKRFIAKSQRRRDARKEIYANSSHLLPSSSRVSPPSRLCAKFFSSRELFFNGFKHQATDDAQFLGERQSGLGCNVFQNRLGIVIVA
jgi:hypothetical protein